MENLTADETAKAPVKFQKELIFQKPTSFFELEVKRSYQRYLRWSLKKRIAEIEDEEEDMLRHVQLHETYNLIRKHQVGVIFPTFNRSFLCTHTFRLQ